jgi:hypothetical protein
VTTAPSPTACETAGPNLYAIRCVQPDRHAFVVRNPLTGELANYRDLDDGYCIRPLTVALEEAQALLDEFRKLVPHGDDWALQLAPRPCPACGRDIWANDGDFLYPKTRELKAWRAGCNEHDGGCGFELTASGTRQDMLASWNAVPRHDADPA